MGTSLKGKEIEMKTDVDENEVLEIQNKLQQKESKVLLLEKLVEKGVSISDIKKLKDEGYYVISQITRESITKLCRVKGISENKAKKLKESAEEFYPLKFVSGKDVYNERKDLYKLCTGSKQLDELLGGGMESGSTIEIFGEFKTGKTQICHTLAVTCQLDRKQGGNGGIALYIDTENTFRPERIKKISERFGLDPEKTLEQIYVGKASSTEEQNRFLISAMELFTEKIPGVVIIDSATAKYRNEYIGRGELSTRQIELGQFLKKCKDVADIFQVPVVYTNQVVSQVDGMSSVVSDPKKPIGGNIMAHSSVTRLFLRSGRANIRICKVYDSPNLPSSECSFCITENGIEDAEE